MNYGIGQSTSTIGQSTGGGMSLNSVSETLGRSFQATNDQLENFMNTMDPNDMNDVMQLQMYMIEWETTVQTQSSVYKGIGDTLKSVANNVGS